MIRYKDGVPQNLLHPRLILEVLPALDRIFRAFNLDCWITSTSDGKHKKGSKHYSRPWCEALDIRSKHMEVEQDKYTALLMMRQKLGKDYDVIYEHPRQANQHFHLELDVKPEPKQAAVPQVT